MQQKTSNVIIIAAVVAVVGLGGGFLIGQMVCENSHDHGQSSMTETGKEVALRSAMRQAWADHMQYTYLTIRSFADENKSLDADLNRLLDNQKDIGNAIKPYYGEEAGNKLSTLLTTHIKQAVPVLTAAKAGDTVALDKANADWYANAQEIADFLSTANPTNWPKSATESMMKEHIDTTLTYTSDYLKGDYAQADKDYDKAYAHMMMMADTLTDGIVKQYADKF